ncbi:phosphatidylinositol-glycan biosynthesis class X protein-like isoform X1 [Amphiura filiformis]|uniref:phosphatidylinositol-glycan biosynthesis class X protein-like isoform X1 n=1 Tax=Amphiura filiformis TaxID=82378 RepID=UPI003B20D2D2
MLENLFFLPDYSIRLGNTCSVNNKPHIIMQRNLLCTIFLFLGEYIEADKGSNSQFCNLNLKDVILTRNITNQGFQRDLVSVIEITFEDHTPCNTCWFMLVEAVPRGMYVDLDQIKAVESFGAPKVLSYEEIDVEQPAYLSPEHTILVYSPHLMTDSKHYGTIHVDMPIHLRYHRPSRDTDVTSALVELQHPNVMIRCQGSASGNEFDLKDLYQAPCDSLNTSMCAWQDLKYRMNNGKQLQFQVPVGQQNHTVIISIVTFAATISGVLVLLWDMHLPHKSKIT